MSGDPTKQAAQVLDFWFEQVPREKWFAKDEALDDAIRSRFGALRDQLLAERARPWRETPEQLLAAIILLDQFSRNLHRSDAEAFAADAIALELTHFAIDQGWEPRYSAEQLQFLYMPLMHAENAREQALSVLKFEALGNADSLASARDHQDVFLRFGRFPSRNAALGRTSTVKEQSYLAQSDAGW